MPTEGETDLNTLLRNLKPEKAGEWAFVAPSSLQELGARSPLMTFQEAEGMTAIVSMDEAQGLDIRFTATRIDLTIHSSLSAVGLTAAVSQALAEAGIATNVVAANYHDYLFVPTDRVDEAIERLNRLSDPIQIRRATLQDLDTLVPLFDAYRSFYLQPSDLLGARQYLEARMGRLESVVYLAEFEGKAVGFAQLYPTFTSVAMRRVWVLNDLFVAPEARKLGVGSRLLRTSREFAKRDGAVRLMLTTAVDNFTAQGVYEADGWKRVDQFYQYRFDL